MCLGVLDEGRVSSMPAGRRGLPGCETSVTLPYSIQDTGATRRRLGSSGVMPPLWRYPMVSVRCVMCVWKFSRAQNRTWWQLTVAGLAGVSALEQMRSPRRRRQAARRLRHLVVLFTVQGARGIG